MFTGNISNDLSHFPILNMAHHGYNHHDILISKGYSWMT